MEPQRDVENDFIKNHAYQVYSEWGPDRRIPRPERMADQFPSTDEATRLAWMAEFDHINRTIWNYAETGAVRLQSRAAFLAYMTAAFPFMNEESLGHAWSLAVFYTVHEGY